ncbi:LysR family transcriptional regulator [Convivina intestini]|uniref:DNA-binding transcriptional LysR family regulator n=1 Tax=Convivina intestini TaxID=1505726 RepID=A0A2U1D9I7_9LACO|nr:LysR family transcriptional regulator [Convivina intestini]PVY84354.1 DNA-binding transcriptional LysR family regulator [Convivina intestini]CAH1857089.1 Hydrogen peroxide-inducible genes activator [Convivina intestini]SDC06892.1 DNA-binding transcriptional regulator, LysR family [Leuconostocaceae bacterium R-53105]
MRITDLQYYLALTDNHNFSQVSQQFHVSQPTVSLAIQRLEKEVGAQLAIRSSHHNIVSLTHAGQVFAQHAQAMLEQYNLALTEIGRIDEQSLLLGLPPIIQISYFPEIAGRLSNQALEHLKTVEVGAHKAIQLLQDGKLDASFLGYLDAIDQNDFQVIQFDQRPFEIVVANDHPLANHSAISFRELANQNFILLKGSFIHKQAFEQLAQANHLQPDILFSSSEPYAILNLVSQNRGIGFMVSSKNIQHPNVKFIPLSDPAQPQLNVGFVYRKNPIMTTEQNTIFKEILAAIHTPML